MRASSGLSSRLAPSSGRIRRALRLVAAAALLVVPVTPLTPVTDLAGAASDSVVVTWGLGQETRFQGDGQIEFTATSVDPLKPLLQRVEVHLVESLDTDIDEPTTVLCGSDIAPAMPSRSVSLTWNSRHVGDDVEECTGTVPTSPAEDRLTRNGAYQLRVVVERSGQRLIAAHREVELANAPVAPADLSAGFDAASQEMVVTWTANPEPDVTGYRLDECRRTSVDEECTAGDWSQVGAPGASTTRMAFPVEDAGVYHYRLTAYRPDPAGGTLSASSKAGPVVLQESDADPDDDDGGGDGPDDSDPDGPTGTGPGSTDDDPSSGGGSTDPHQGGDSVQGGSERNRGSAGTARGSVPRRSRLEPRLVQRVSDFDPGYDESLPYEVAQPIDDFGDGGGDLLATEIVPGFAVVPLAIGLAIFVFGMQMRYLAGAAAVAGDGSPVLPSLREALREGRGEFARLRRCLRAGELSKFLQRDPDPPPPGS